MRLGRINVLFCSSNLRLGRIVAGRLERAGLRVEITVSAGTAAERLDTGRHYCLIFLDCSDAQTAGLKRHTLVDAGTVVEFDGTDETNCRWLAGVTKQGAEPLAAPALADLLSSPRNAAPLVH